MRAKAYRRAAIHMVNSNPSECAMTGAHEKNVHRLAERKGFRLDKVGKGQQRFSIVDLASGGRMASGVPDPEGGRELDPSRRLCCRCP